MKTTCGRIHLGPCCINGTRENGSVGPTCEECGRSMTPADREQMHRTWEAVHRIRTVAGAQSRYEAKR